MSLKPFPLAFALAVAQLSSTAHAANQMPERVGDFIAYCTSHFNECRDRIQVLDIAAMAGALWGKDNKKNAGLRDAKRR